MSVKRKYYLFEVLYSLALSFTKATFVIYFISHELSRFEIGLIFGVFNLTVMFAEPITATYAEIFGRKKSLLLGCFLKVIAAAIFIYSTNFTFFIVAEILSGIALTFISGCIMAWAVEAFKEKNETPPLYEIFATCKKYKYLALVVGGLLGAYVGDVSLVLPWLLNGAFFLSLLLIILFFMPTDSSKYVVNKEMDLFKIINGYKLIAKDKCISVLILSSFLTAFSLASIKLFWLPMVKTNFNTGVSVLGWLWVGISGANFLGTYFVKPFVKKFSYKLDALVSFSFVSTIFLVSMIFSINTWWTLLFYFLFEFGKPLYSTVKDDLLNYQIPDESRVTILSFQSVAIKLGRSIGLVVVGLISDKIGMQNAWYVSAMIFFCNMFLYMAVNYWMLRLSHKRVILATT